MEEYDLEKEAIKVGYLLFVSIGLYIVVEYSKIRYSKDLDIQIFSSKEELIDFLVTKRMDGVSNM